MPYKSDAQRKYFHAAMERGDIPKKIVKEFDKESKGKELPEYVEHKAMGGMVRDFREALKDKIRLDKRKKMWMGGRAEEDGEPSMERDDNPDNEYWMPYASSGEPHTAHKLEAEGGMPYERAESLRDYGIDSKADYDQEDEIGPFAKYLKKRMRGF